MSVHTRTTRNQVKSLWMDGDPFAFESAELIEQWMRVEQEPEHPVGWDLDVYHPGPNVDGPHTVKAEMEDGLRGRRTAWSSSMRKSATARGRLQGQTSSKPEPNDPAVTIATCRHDA